MPPRSTRSRSGSAPTACEIVVKPGKLRAVREARRRHGQRAGRPHSRRADGRRWRLKLLGAAEERRARSASSTATRCSPRTAATGRTCSGVRGRQPAARAREAEDVEPVQDDDAGADHRRRRRGRCCSCRARSGSTRSTVQAITGQPTVKFGPYVQKGKDYRSITNEEQLLTISLAACAPDLLSLPKVFRRGAGANMAAKGPLREFGDGPDQRQVSRGQGRQASACTSPTERPTRRSSKGDRLDAMPPGAGLRAAGSSAARRSSRRVGLPPRSSRRQRRRPPRRRRPLRRRGHCEEGHGGEEGRTGEEGPRRVRADRKAAGPTSSQARLAPDAGSGSAHHRSDPVPAMGASVGLPSSAGAG